MTFPGRRLRRKTRKSKLLEDVQRARPRSCRREGRGVNVSRCSQRRSLPALGQKRKLRVGNGVSGG